MSNNAKIDLSDQIKYTIIDQKVTIIGYKGEPEYIVIPDTIEGHPVTEIRDNSFYNCSTLKQIQLPDTLTLIGHHCFYGCTSLEGIDLPESVSEIGMGCFCKCSNLSYVGLPSKLKVIPDSCFRYCNSLKSAELPESIVSIDKFAFSCCTDLDSVTLDSSLVSIGDYAFFMCDSLKNISIPESVTCFGNEAIGYHPVPSGHSVISDLKITCNKDSAAYDYAQSNAIELSYGTESSAALDSLNNCKLPIDVPDFFFWSGLILLTAALISVFISQRKKKKRSRF